MNEMTGRAEIERLLQMTGRTLEELPERYDFSDTYDAYCRAKPSPGQMLCHQSDVIELLVGALRDALDKQPKWISVEERLPTDKDATEEGRVACVLSKMCGTIAGERRFYLWEAVVSNPEFFAYWMPLPEPPKEE